MIQSQFKELTKLYQRAAEGESLEESHLFASAVSFLENLKFALQDGELTREMGMAMIGVLSQHSEAYDRLLEKQKKSGTYKASRDVKEMEQRRELKAKLVILAKDLGEFFRQTEGQASEKKESHPIGQAVQARGKPRRPNRKNWLRS